MSLEQGIKRFILSHERSGWEQRYNVAVPTFLHFFVCFHLCIVGDIVIFLFFSFCLLFHSVVSV